MDRLKTLSNYACWMRIGVQLPDGLKRKAIEICEKFENIVLSGESCFGACDIDLALLNDVDVLYHYAHTKLLNIEKVVYIPFYIDYDTEKVAERLKEIKEQKIALISTAQYCHKLPELKKSLERRGFFVELKKGNSRVEMPGQVLGCNYTALKNTEADAVVFVGDGVFHARGALLYTGKKVYSINPLNFELKEINAQEFTRERYFLISRCVGLKNLGILVSTKPGQKRLRLAEKIREKALKKGLKAIIVYIGEITPEKLENLPFDFYVNTACPRISYDDYKRFKMPIITPQEFEVLIGERKDLAIDEIELEREK
ncbi:MAG: diphthamide biosynthesis enzyme Dph2 [Archaeoglobaceae archaeon]